MFFKMVASVAFRTLSQGVVFEKGAVVIDNSVAMRWLFEDGSAADNRFAGSVLNYIEAQRPSVIVPYIWTYEAAFVVNYYVNKGALGWGDGTQHLKSLDSLFTVAIDKLPPADLFEFSNVHGVSSYDAAYLMLARGQALPIATLDKKMRKIATKINVSLFGS